MDKNITFVFSDGHKKQIPLSLKQFLKLPESVMELIYINGEYSIKSNVQEEVFVEFINHLIGTNNDLVINQNNIIQIHLLNIEFGITSDLNLRPEYQQNFNNYILLNIKSRENQDKSNYEKHISKNLDFFIENYKEEMYSISINSLYNIFNDKDRILNNHDEAYKFITNATTSGENTSCVNNMFILLESLDGSKLSNEILNECISKRNDHFLYMPQNCYSSSKEMTPQMLTKAQIALKECEKIQDQIKTGQMKTVNLPQNLTFVPANFAWCCETITDVIIPPTVVFISQNAFNQCKSLKHVEIPSSVISIGNSSFCECTSLSEITVPSSVIEIGNSAFYKCNSLLQLPIPLSVIYIGSSSFCECTFSEIVVPSSVVSLGMHCFGGCKSLRSADLSKCQITKIGNCTFANCTNLEKVLFPPSLTNIEVQAFNQCQSLKDIEFPPSLLSIKDDAFNTCSSITKIKIPASTTFLGERCFMYCGLKEIEILSSSVLIKDGAFYDKPGNVKVKIPSSTTFSTNAFPQYAQIITTY